MHLMQVVNRKKWICLTENICATRLLHACKFIVSCFILFCDVLWNVSDLTNLCCWGYRYYQYSYDIININPLFAFEITILILCPSHEQFSFTSYFHFNFLRKIEFIETSPDSWKTFLMMYVQRNSKCLTRDDPRSGNWCKSKDLTNCQIHTKIT
jgi:hypothetical protein